jgi:chemotaxis protein CheX
MNIGQDIIGATTDVFSTMLMMDLVVGDPVDGPAGGEVESNITAMLGLGGDIRGMLAVHCPAAVAMAITGGFLGMDVDELNEDVKDAIGEIANMIAGNLKTAFAGHDLKIELAIPTSIIGKSYRVGGMVGARRVAVPFTMDQGTFLVELKYIVNG